MKCALLLVLVLVALPMMISGQSGDVSAQHSLIFGPGLSPDVFVLPCRYFIVELRDENNKR